MKPLHAAGLSLALGLAVLVTPAVAKTPVPKAELVPVTPTSHPFGAADHQLRPEPLARMGYVEEEFFLSGNANVYDWPSAAGAVVRTPNVPYVTRVLVRRPANRGKFSGRIVVEMMNPSNLLDLNIGWAIHRDQLMREGDAWVGVTAKPIAVVTLKTFDPQRYAPLSWKNPLPENDPRNCNVQGDTTKATENGLVWDIFTQLGAWLRSSEPSNPFNYGVRPGGRHPVKYLYAWGYSQTGSFTYTYLNAVNPVVIREDGRPMFDGALIAVSGGPGAINQCSGGVPAGDPRRRITNPGIPVVHVMSQSDFAGYAPNRRPDSNDIGNGYRDYDLAGAGHATPDELYYGPSPADITKGGRTPPPVGCNEGQRSRLPSKAGFNAILANLQEWVEEGRPPPPGAVIKVENGRAVTDEHGNVVGGVRNPYVDVPTSTWFGNATGASFCRIAGYERPFEAAKLKALYGTKANYVRKVRASVNDLVKARYLTRADGAEILAEARAFNWPE